MSIDICISVYSGGITVSPSSAVPAVVPKPGKDTLAVLAATAGANATLASV